jgi:hypothetical protein
MTNNEIRLEVSFLLILPCAEQRSSAPAIFGRRHDWVEANALPINTLTSPSSFLLLSLLFPLS